MRLAFIFNWHFNMQRPHHWVVQAVSRGHEVHVYSPAKPPWRPLLVPYQYATKFYFSPWRVVEHGLSRLFGPKSKIGERLRLLTITREVSIWEKLWNGETAKQYDAVIFCSSPPPFIMRRQRWGIPLVYDCMDKWDGFPGADPKILDYEDSLASIADMIWAATPSLAERLGAKHGGEKCHVIPNGCDYNNFAMPKDIKRPRGWREGRPVIGYSGHIGAWFCWDLIIETARALPTGIIWLLGQRTVPVPSDLPKNVILEGFVSYEELPAYYAGFDICVIPFKGDSLLSGVSPIKLYEYLAAGKPVVATSMPDTVNLQSEGIVEVANEPASFARACVRLVNNVMTHDLVSQRQKIARDHSWAARWRLCESLIGQITNK